MLSTLTGAIAIFPPDAVLFTIQMAIILAAKEVAKWIQRAITIASVVVFIIESSSLE